MSEVKPIYIVALVLAIALVAYIKVSNPHRKFSTTEYWEHASVESVYEISADALKPGNRNGPVLMWAAMAAENPQILAALVARGAEINESDGDLMGTPLSGAAGYSKHAAIIDELIRLGADIEKMVNNRETALMVAARYNKNPGIVRTLLKHGANKIRKNDSAQSALQIAKEHDNEIAVKELTATAN